MQRCDTQNWTSRELAPVQQGPKTAEPSHFMQLASTYYIALLAPTRLGEYLAAYIYMCLYSPGLLRAVSLLLPACLPTTYPLDQNHRSSGFFQFNIKISPRSLSSLLVSSKLKVHKSRLGPSI